MKGREGRIVCVPITVFGVQAECWGGISASGQMPEALEPPSSWRTFRSRASLTCCGQGVRRGHIAASGPDRLSWLLTPLIQLCPPGEVIGPPCPAAPHPCDSAEAVCCRSCLRGETRLCQAKSSCSIDGDHIQ